MATLAAKLGVKPGHRVLLLDAAGGPAAALVLPARTTAAAERKGPFDVVLLFVADRAALKRRAKTAIRAVRPDGRLWIAYQKGAARVQTDRSRAVGWETMTDAGWRGVSLIAVDDVWSAMRFRPKPP